MRSFTYFAFFPHDFHLCLIVDSALDCSHLFSPALLTNSPWLCPKLPLVIKQGIQYFVL